MAMKTKHAFVGYVEGPLLFRPTYDNGTEIYDSSEKNRAPAWTGESLLSDTKCVMLTRPPLDRILYSGQDVSRISSRTASLADTSSPARSESLPTRRITRLRSSTSLRDPPSSNSNNRSRQTRSIEEIASCGRRLFISAGRDQCEVVEGACCAYAGGITSAER